ncbi:MAG: ABC transporter permease, partial [Bacteroidaceae bacterium]|nr:ABC transporter permease [Bacteroidaceae bacterium]
IFGREYGGMLVVTSAFAFAVGYMIMHRWLQQYEQQTAISWWLYLLILVGMALVISLTVLHRVSRAAGENPSVVIKNE